MKVTKKWEVNEKAEENKILNPYISTDFNEKKENQLFN